MTYTYKSIHLGGSPLFYCKVHRAKSSPSPNAHLQQERLDAKTMEQAYDQLARLAISRSKSIRPSQRLMIGIAGAPGSGKTTLAREVIRRINFLTRSEIAVNVPMDGFHFYKRELDRMENPTNAHARRGAHWTFDARSYVDCLNTLKNRPNQRLQSSSITNDVMRAPSFDHGVGDPMKDNIKIYPRHRIILSEGNYLLLEIPPWNALIDSNILDDSWFVDCNINEAMQRIFKRQTGHGLPAKESQKRIIENDRPNAELVDETKHRARIIVPSIRFRG